ncbi:MAG: anion transporter [Acidobacteria bacterium]|nr:MAG: anion transporter [Acidobacteriota bacterium]REK11833.1 MAG: anion transporter [Acidobacteriota bacterium]
MSRWGLLLGPLLAAATWALLSGGELSRTGCAVAAVGVLMGVYWLSEALPVAATALAPLALLPVLTAGEIGISEVAAPYAHEMIFLFMGGFLIALAMQQWGLHRRIALHIILAVGERPSSIVLGFMLASAALSMWISNTATTVMMLPIALSVIELVRQRFEDARGVAPEELAPGRFAFAICLLLGTAYAASIGGIATLIGTPPNLMMAAFLSESYGREMGFADWLPFGLPFSLVMLPATWWILVRWVYPLRLGAIPGGRSLIRGELERCGPMRRQERVVLVVFACTAAAWVLRGWLEDVVLLGGRPLAGLSDSGIAIAAALLLFAWPSGASEGAGPARLLTWPQAVRLPWGILLLFGGGLSLAAAVRSSGLDRHIGGSIASLSGAPTLVLVAVVAVIVLLLTEMTSNAATTATFLPIVAAAATGLGLDPLLLVLPTALAASCAFMMPVATPPNAIVFASGEMTIPQMCRAGVWINLLALALIVVWVQLLGRPLFGL